MSYKSVETALLTVIAALGNYTSTGQRRNISQGDYRILAKGVNRAVVLQPGSIASRGVAVSTRRMRTLWEVYIELYIPFRTEMNTIATALRDDRQEIIDQVDKYPTLNASGDGIVMAMITRGLEPDIWQGEGRSWWRQVLICQVEERATITIAE